MPQNSMSGPEQTGAPVFAQPAGHHLAELNIATLVADLDDPAMADFMNALDAVNAVAERSPGFVWRLKDESGNATGIKGAGDPREIYNLSVWDAPKIWNSISGTRCIAASCIAGTSGSSRRRAPILSCGGLRQALCQHWTRRLQGSNIFANRVRPAMRLAGATCRVRGSGNRPAHRPPPDEYVRRPAAPDIVLSLRSAIA